MNVRDLAYESLKKIICQDGYSNIILSETIKKHGITDIDRRFYTELVYGVMRHLNYLDWLIDRLSSRPSNKLPDVCKNILRLGLYQIFCLDRVPNSAACNESVKLARLHGNEGMVKFVNAILRNAIRKEKELQIPTLNEDKPLHISLTYHQPLWLVRQWLKDYGTDDTLQLCQYFEVIPDLCLRANTIKTSRAELLARFNSAGIEAVPATSVPDGFYLRKIPDIRDLTELREGLCQVQDEASMLVAMAVAPSDGDIIVDACAAPGGKATHLGALLHNTGTVHAVDIYEHKLTLIESNADRLGLHNIKTHLHDARALESLFAGMADKVLVDAPCSGLGILRRKPDLRWKKKPSDLALFPPLQSAILDSAAKCVKPGGVLVYSTCTMNVAENDDVIASFLRRHDEFFLDDIYPYIPLHKKSEKTLQLLPQKDGLDGFYIARLLRKQKEQL